MTPIRTTTAPTIPEAMPQNAHTSRVVTASEAGHAAERELDAVEHPVDQRRPLHDVAHEDEQRDRQEGVVGHHAVRPLHHQVEDLVVVPVLAGVQNATNPKIIPRPISVKAVGKPIMIATTMSPKHR